MTPERERGPSHHADDDGGRGGQPVGRQLHRLLLAIPLAGGPERQHGPDQEAAEQQQVSQRVVGKQMGQGPDLDAQYHRVAKFGFDGIARHVSGHQQHKGEQRQQGGQVVHAAWRRPQHHRALPRQPVAPDDQHKTGDRQGAVAQLPDGLAALCQLGAAPVIGEDAHRMHPQEQDETGNKFKHGFPCKTWSNGINPGGAWGRVQKLNP